MKKQLQNSFRVLCCGLAFSAAMQAQTTLTLRPNATTGNDAYITDLNPNTNYGNLAEISAIAWTNGGTPTIARSLVNFDLSALPAWATISSASLSLYAYNSPGNGAHSTLSGSNQSVLQRITGSWTESSVTWANQPATTTQNQVLLAASTSSVENYTNIDVTGLVQDMVNNPTSSYGMMLKLTNEQYYRRMVFGSSDNTDSTLRPKLVIVYTVFAGVQEAKNKSTTFSLYPNPSSRSVNITVNNLGEASATMELLNYQGQVIDTRTGIQNSESIDVSAFAKGLYFVRLRSQEGTSTQKLLVE